MLRLMRRTEHIIGRVIAGAGLVAGLIYLLWRARYSLADTDLWVSLPTLLIEVSGFVGSLLLVWALWPHRLADTAPQGATSAVDVIVRVHHQHDHEVRATLIALRSVASVGEVIVVNTATEAVTGASELANALKSVGTARCLLLDAGDVPTADIITRLTPLFDDQRVAIVQGLCVSFANDSIEHGPHGRHDLTFERAALNPALGSRGCALWTGSGSLVAVDALREALLRADVTATATATAPATATIEMHWMLSTVLLSAGWRIVAPADVAVVAPRVERIESVVDADRRARVSAARRLVAGHGRSFAWRQRLSMLAWCVRPLSGLRRAAFITVVVIALYAGSPPFNASLPIMLAAWLPGFVATSVGLSVLSGWTLRPGDRTRWSLISMGAACSSWRATTVAAARGAKFGAGLIVAITAMCLVLMLRGMSDQFTHALGRMPRLALVGLIVVALWLLALSFDVLRLVARRSHRRRGQRVVSALPAIVGDRSTKIVDLTPHSAGLLSQTAMTLGEQLLLTSTIVTPSGTTEMRVPCIVRSLTVVDHDTWRSGVTFGDVDEPLADALSEFCIVVPMWNCLRILSDASGSKVRRVDYADATAADGDVSFVGSGLLRFLAIVALVGAVVSSASLLVDAFAGAIGVSLLLPRHRRSRPTWQSSNQLPVRLLEND
ncbi:hypothetical protein BH10ACT2_BH10ACT2_13470 [soil metagenome]